MAEKPHFYCPTCKKPAEDIVETYHEYDERKVWNSKFEEYEIEDPSGQDPDTIKCFDCKTKVVELDE